MTLTKLLCKYLDRDNKGYVTAGDLMTAGMIATISILLFAAFIRGAAVVYNVGLVSALQTKISDSWTDVLCVPVFVLVAWVGVAAVCSTLLMRVLGTIADIWTTKIATCERKDGDDE